MATIVDIIDHGYQTWDCWDISVGGEPNFFASNVLVHNCQNVYGRLDVNAVYEKSIKLDGTSCTVYTHNGTIGVCSRNQELKLDDSANAENLYIRTIRDTGLLDVLGRLDASLAIQGEIRGPGIQKNRHNLQSIQFCVFDVYDIRDQRYRTPQERAALLEVLRTEYGVSLNTVPILGIQAWPELASRELAIQHAAELVYNGLPGEGYVYKRADGLDSFKVISNTYLLTHGL